MKAVVWLFIIQFGTGLGLATSGSGKSYAHALTLDGHEAGSESGPDCDGDLKVVVLKANVIKATPTQVETFKPSELSRIIDPRLDYLNEPLDPAKFATPLLYVKALEERAAFMRARLENQGMVLKPGLKITLGMIAAIHPLWSVLIRTAEDSDREITVIFTDEMAKGGQTLSLTWQNFADSGLVDSAGRKILVLLPGSL